MSARIALLATGGTIASRTHRAGRAVAATATDLLEASRSPTGTVVTPIDLAARLSSATSTDDLLDLARAVAAHAAGHDAVVVTHGTDTLEETAFLLALVHHHDAPVVVTGAQLPLDHPETDGPANLATALEWAGRRRPGVTVAFDGQIWPAIGVRKLHTTARRAFAVPGTGPVATTGPDGLVEHRPAPAIPPLPLPGHLPRVDVIAQYLGADTTALDAALRARADGLVIAAFGDGNTTPELTRRTVALLRRGMPVAVASRVAAGPVHGHYRGAGASLADAGALMASGLSPWQARLLLATAIAHEPEHPIRTARRWLAAAEPCGAVTPPGPVPSSGRHPADEPEEQPCPTTA
ncbi:asparaginase [Pseudonocardia adelaidensis]|uniref:asparaginase n=1 Tax=Pseudonocardia adelaidensis TaxID=648754 RepID=A0ABP9NIQ3_9PSEU